MEKTVNFDPYVIQAIGWLLMFLFTSLLAIIIWLAKSVIKKVDTIAEKQDQFQLDLSNVTNSTRTASEDLNEVYDRLKDIPEFIKKGTIIEQSLLQIKEDLGTIKQGHNDHAKRLTELEKITSKNSEWIRLNDRLNLK